MYELAINKQNFAKLRLQLKFAFKIRRNYFLCIFKEILQHPQTDSFQLYLKFGRIFNKLC